MASEKIDALELDIVAKANVDSLDKLIDKLGQLSKEIDKVNGKKLSVELKESAGASDKLTSSFGNQLIKVAALVSAYKKLENAVASGIAKSTVYMANLNVFNTALGDYADNAMKYAESVKDALGIDPSNWIKAQGTFNTLIEGLGVGGAQAAYMSQNLTQLSYDLASFKDLTVEQATQKIRSAISGEIEPARNLGYDLSQARLTQIAQDPKFYGRTTYSINEETGALEANSVAVDNNTRRVIANFNQLTQAEKVQLRYIALMTQNTQAQGNWARTLNDPNMQIKIFKQELDMVARELGNIFIPALNKALPYIIAFGRELEKAFHDIALFFGFKLPDMSDRMNVSSAVNGYEQIENATGRSAKHAKKIKDYLLGIDELNVFKPDDPTSGGGGVATNPYAFGSTYATPGYDFLSGAIDSAIAKAKQDLDKLQQDFKKKPLIVAAEILFGGGAELGSRIWELILGKTPEQFEADAKAHGFNYGQEFCLSFYQATTNRGENFIESIMGSPEEMGRRAAEAGNEVGKQFALELGYSALQAIKSIPGAEFLYGLSGVKLDSLMAKYEKELAPKRKFVSTEMPTLGNTSADAARKSSLEAQGKSDVMAYAKGVASGASAVQSAANTSLYQASVNGATNNGTSGTKFYNTSASEAKKYAEGMSKYKVDVYNAGKNMSNQGLTGAKTHQFGYEGAGKNAGQGFVLGIDKNKSNANKSGETLAKSVLMRLKDVLKIASPSKATAEMGMFTVAGYANSVRDNTYMATNAIENMGKKVLATANTSLVGTIADPMGVGGYSSSTTGVGSSIGANNDNAMALIASQVYQAVVAGMTVVADTMSKDTKIVINGREVFQTVQEESRKRGVAIGNGAFSY